MENKTKATGTSRGIQLIFLWLLNVQDGEKVVLGNQRE
jgi:hypothetical protein